MAFRLIKLISAQTLIADTYKVRDLEKYLQHIIQLENIDPDILFNSEHNSLLLLIDPVEIIYKLTKDGALSSTLSFYLPHAEDSIIPLPENRIMTLASPNASILKSYSDYISEIKSKKELKSRLYDKFGSPEMVDYAHEMLEAIDPKKDTKH